MTVIIILGFSSYYWDRRETGKMIKSKLLEKQTKKLNMLKKIKLIMMPMEIGGEKEIRPSKT